MMGRRSVRVTVTGRVQGVGYRAFVERRAARHELSGWVRNRSDGSVEAVFEGEEDAVAAMIAACRKGPQASHVAELIVVEHGAGVAPGFTVLPTA
jgi:acylphosphatase